MKKYGVSETRQNLTSLLKGDEFQVIDKKSGKVLATVLTKEVEVKTEKTEIENKYKKNIKKTIKDEFIPVGTPCIHGLLYHRGCHY